MFSLVCRVRVWVSSESAVLLSSPSSAALSAMEASCRVGSREAAGTNVRRNETKRETKYETKRNVGILVLLA